jgi:serine/threonine protein kinase
MIKLGSGTYGKVYSNTLSSDIAIKTIRFANLHSAIKEIVALNSINHPNVIRIHKVDVSLEKQEISVHIDRYSSDLENFRMKCDNFIDLYMDKCLAQILVAIQYLHDHNVMHRDVSPSNVLINFKDNEPNIALCDFGLAGFYYKKNWSYDTTVCASTYRAPEIFTGIYYLKYEKNMDVWSFGCLLFFLLTSKDMLDYREYTSLFPKRRESSLFISHFFGLPLYNNHLVRLKKLRELPASTCKEKYRSELEKHKVPQTAIDKYIDMLTDSLNPDYKTRMNIGDLMDKYKNNYRANPVKKHTVLNNLYGDVLVTDLTPKMVIEFSKETGKLPKEIVELGDKLFMNAGYMHELYRFVAIYMAGMFIEWDYRNYESALFKYFNSLQLGRIMLHLLHLNEWRVNI